MLLSNLRFSFIGTVLAAGVCAGCSGVDEEKVKRRGSIIVEQFLEHRANGEGGAINKYFTEYNAPFHDRFKSDTYRPLRYENVGYGIEDRLGDRFYYLEYRVEYENNLEAREYYALDFSESVSVINSIGVYYEDADVMEEFAKLYEIEKKDRR